jgi:GT2 family glycosyltransferase
MKMFIFMKTTKSLNCLDKAINENKVELTTNRIEIARNNTWDHRVKELHLQINLLFPKVSIIVISYNSLMLLRECIESIFAETTYPNWELVIVDNCSDNSTRNYLIELEKSSSNVKVILNSENYGFAFANNQGIATCEDVEFYILLNNDTRVTPGWIERLIYYASKSDIGLVGAVTNNCGNEAKIEVSYHNNQQMREFARTIRKSYLGETFDIPVVAMFCATIKKEIIDQVGVLDERFGIGMFEDDDFAKRVRKAGFRVVCAEDVFIHHYGSASFKNFDQTTYAELFESNKAKFEEKWGKWVPHKHRYFNAT